MGRVAGWMGWRIALLVQETSHWDGILPLLEVLGIQRWVTEKKYTSSAWRYCHCVGILLTAQINLQDKVYVQ